MVVKEKSVCMKKGKMNTATSMSTKILVMKLGIIMQLNLIDLQGVDANSLGGGVNTIIIKCVLFLHKGLNAEKIVVECDIASPNYALFAQSNRLNFERITYTRMLRIMHRVLCFQRWTG